MPNQAGEKKGVRVEVWMTSKLAAYLDELVIKEGFGDSRPDVLRKFAWDAINDLIASGRLKQR